MSTLATTATIEQVETRLRALRLLDLVVARGDAGYMLVVATTR